jgi:hypothetical protein
MPSESSSDTSALAPGRLGAKVGGGATAIWHSEFSNQALNDDLTLEPGETVVRLPASGAQ